ncbi:MAG: efflux RND transporter periplasmic adaptor subunit [Kiritimatiellae bacterium]|nr:efflux RND transporter periplasmic adaptor subunit [Kiritimatiellia bacterium]
MKERRTDETDAAAPAARRHHRPSAWWIALLLAAMIGAVALLLPRQTEPRPATPPRTVPVRVVTATSDGVRDVLDLPGRVEAIYAATLAAERAGRVVQVAVERGDRVRAGAPVARVAATLWEARRDQAAVELREAERDLRRREALAESGAIAPHELDAARARADRARAAFAEAEEYVRQCTVTAPSDGEITERLVEPGEHVAEGQAVARLVDVSNVRIVVEVPEQRVDEVTPGTPVRVVVGDPPLLVRTGQIAAVAAEADPRSRTFRAEIRLDNRERRLRAGQIVRVEVDRPMPAGWVAVPLPAVIPRRGEHVVFVATGGHAERRRVELERIAGGFALLSAGVVAGESVVIEGQRDLADGTAVEIVAEGTPPP